MWNTTMQIPNSTSSPMHHDWIPPEIGNELDNMSINPKQRWHVMKSGTMQPKTTLSLNDINDPLPRHRNPKVAKALLRQNNYYLSKH